MNNILLMGGALDGRIEVIKRASPTLTFYGQPTHPDTELVEHTYHQMGTFGNFTIYQSSGYDLNFVDQLVSSYINTRQVGTEAIVAKPDQGFADVVAILAEYTQLQTSLITGSTSLDDMHLDSLDKVELVMHLEEKFGVEIPDHIADKLETVDDLVGAVQSGV